MLQKGSNAFKVFTPFWRVAEQIYINSVPSKNIKIKKRLKNFHILKKYFT